MILAIIAVVLGLALLVWSADRFVAGSAATAWHLGMPPLLIGMVVVGFGTSAPELVVSATAALQGNPTIALGNAYGSNISNIALILGLTALLSPIAVHSRVIRKELPVLFTVTLLAAFLIWDGDLGRFDSWLLLGVFAGLMAWTVFQGLRQRTDALGAEMEGELVGHPMPLGGAVFRLATGLALLVVSSRVLVWGAVEIARTFGVSDLVIGLTVLAVGTSLPELASAIMASRKGEHDIALGNVLGSNLFNTLVAVGVAGAIHPTAVAPEVFSRDILVMVALTFSVFAMGYGFRGREGRINRYEGMALLAAYLAYSAVLMASAFGGSG